MEYLCRIKIVSIFALAKRKGPFVYRLGRKIFILERGVRFSYGLQINKENLKEYCSKNGKP